VDQRESKLPAWAQNELRAARVEARALRRQVADLSREDSLVVANPDRGERDVESINLGDRATVRFTLASGMIDVSLRDGHLHVDAFTGALAITPWVSNVVHVRVVDFPRGT
jgi:hypothetical protein